MLTQAGYLLFLIPWFPRPPQSLLAAMPRQKNAPQQPVAKARAKAGARHRNLKQKLANTKGAARIQIEILHYKNSTELLIPRLKFQRVVRELVADICNEKNVDQEDDHEDDQEDENGVEVVQEDDKRLRFNSQALHVLQEAAEDYLVRGFEDAVKCASHAKRVTIMPIDQYLSQKLRGQ